MPTTLRESQIADHLILMVALDVRDANKDEPTIFVTKDVNLRIRADALGLTAMDFEARAHRHRGAVLGHRPSCRQRPPTSTRSTRRARWSWPRPTSTPNQYVLLRDRDSPSHSALGRFDGSTQELVPLRKMRDGVWGIRPRNKEQHCALDLLLPTTSSSSRWSARPARARRCWRSPPACRRWSRRSVYSKLLVSRPIFPLGRDVGYLPGDLEEKLNPWMQPIYDNVEFLMGLSKTERKNGRSYQELIDMGFIEIEPLTYIRGRSIPNQFIIVDEAQNLTPHEVKTIITRVGEATKVVLTGDPYQIDNPYVDATSNGLTTVVEKFKGEAIAGHVTLSKGERSQLAELASNVLWPTGPGPGLGPGLSRRPSRCRCPAPRPVRLQSRSPVHRVQERDSVSDQVQVQSRSKSRSRSRSVP